MSSSPSTVQTSELIAEHLPLEAQEIQATVDRVLQEELFWFPVRHHSARAASHVATAIRARRPKLVLIEGPSEAAELIRHLADSRTKPPVAIYSSYRDDDNVLGLAGIHSPAPEIPARFACWFPLCEYSPEYVAIRTGIELGAEVRFIDLPHAALIRPRLPAADESPSTTDSQGQPSGDAAASPPETCNGPQCGTPQALPEPDSESSITQSDFYQALTRAAGFRSWDETWDTLFEFGPEVGYEQFRRELLTFCAAVRSTLNKDILAVDGTLERERFMWSTIRRAQQECDARPDECFIVCGGLHAFLDRDDSQEPPPIPAGTVYTTVVPYSFFRISEHSGYASGNRAPQFYQMHWETQQQPGTGLLVDYVVRVLKQVRKRGESASAADAIAVTQHARLLAVLRGRSLPILEDLHDALITCCCKGDPQSEGIHLRRGIADVDIGTKIGRVTPDLGQLPIVHDFYKQIDDLELDEVFGGEKRLKLELDRRTPRDAARSAFLHRLACLEIPLALPKDSAGGHSSAALIFRERWALRWKPDVEATLIERTLYGDTIETAALAKLRELIATDEHEAGKTCERLRRALEMDLPNLVRELEAACAAAIDGDVRFVSLSQALTHLCVIEQYATYRDVSRETLEDLIVRCFNRACFAIADIIAAPEEEFQAVIKSLLSLSELVLRGDREALDSNLFTAQVRHAADDTPVPFLRGACLGILAEMRVITATALADEIALLAKAPQDRLVTAGDILDGMLTTSKTSILLGADALIGAVDELLRSAEWETFLVMLPRLRSAFERLSPTQRDSLAATVAQRYGLKERRDITELRTSAGAALRIAELDRRVSEILRDWEFT